MTVYGRSDIDTVAIGGVDHVHVRTEDEVHMKVTCVVCEPELIAMGWSRDERAVELTYDEVLDTDLAKNEVARFEQLKVAESARAAADAVRGAGRAANASRTRRGPTR